MMRFLLQQAGSDQQQLIMVSILLKSPSSWSNACILLADEPSIDKSVWTPGQKVVQFLAVNINADYEVVWER